MNISLCTISFRHELISFEELIRLASRHAFSGIELWGVHASALLNRQQGDVARFTELLDAYGLAVTMISDYYDLAVPRNAQGQPGDRWERIVRTARTFGTDRVRIFAGSESSRDVSAQSRELYMTRLRELAERAAEDGMYLVIETHPDTLADTLESTVQLLRDVQHPRVKINLDYLHLWETGTEPSVAYLELAPHVVNMHVKNVASSGEACLFAPGNVFAPSGERRGMATLAGGAIDYEALFERESRSFADIPVALEWFGSEPAAYLAAESKWLGRWVDQGRAVTK